jgi:hypothetical protein
VDVEAGQRAARAADADVRTEPLAGSAALS